MRMDIEVTFQLHLHLDLCVWVHTELAILVPALDTIPLVARVAFTLEDLGVLAEGPLEHALSVDVTVRNVATVAKNTVAVFLVLPSLAPAAVLRLWSSSLAWSTLVPIVRAPGAVCARVVPETGVTSLGQRVLVVAHTGTSHSIAPLVAVVLHGESALHDLFGVALATRALCLLGYVPPTWAACFTLSEWLEYLILGLLKGFAVAFRFGFCLASQECENTHSDWD